MIIFLLQCVTRTEPNKLDRDSDTQPNRNQHVHYLKHFESKRKKRDFAIVKRFVVVSFFFGNLVQAESFAVSDYCVGH